MLTIIASMEQELAGLRRELRAGRADPAPACRGGGSTRPTLDLRVVGVGKRAGENLRSLIDRRLSSPGNEQAPPGILLLGFAGAVAPGLETGDLTLSSRYYCQDGPVTVDSIDRYDTEKVVQPDYLAPDPVWWECAVAAVSKMDRPAAQVESLTVKELAATPRIKESIRRRYHVAVVDMEDYWAASAARDLGAPFLSARVVLDQADQGLPGYLPGMARSKAMALLLTAAMPWRIPALLGLARRLPAAQRALAAFALNFCDQLAGASTEAAPPAADPKVLVGTGRSARG